MTGVLPAAIRQPTARTSAALSTPTASSRVRPLGRLVQHPHPRRGDAVLQDDRRAPRRRPRTAPGTAARSRPRRRRRRPLRESSSAADRVADVAVRRLGGRAPAPGPSGRGRHRPRRSPRRRCARPPAPRCSAAFSVRSSRVPAPCPSAIAGHASLPSWPRSPAAIDPSSAARAPDWSTQAVACEVGGRGDLAAQPRPRVRSRAAPAGPTTGGRRAGCPGAAAAAGPAAPAAWPASSATARAERGVGGRRPRRTRPPAASCTAHLRGELVGLRAGHLLPRVAPAATCTRRPAAPARPRTPRAGCAGRSPARRRTGGGDIAAHPRSRDGAESDVPPSAPARRARPSAAARAPLASHAVAAGRPRCAVPGPRPGGSLTTSPRPGPDQRRRPDGAGA